MSKEILDLDALAPEPKYIILGGVEYEVYPPKLRQMIAMQRLFKEMSNANSASDDEGEALMLRIEEVITPLIPSIKNDPDFKIDLSFQQLMKLLSFVNSMSTSGEVAPEEEAAKKKSDSSESSPTS